MLTETGTLPAPAGAEPEPAASAACERISVDFLVVGGGLAGLYTALKLAPHGRCLLLSKVALDVSNSAWAQGGIAAALDPDDTPALHVSDTLRAGRGLCKPSAVRLLAGDGPVRIAEMLRLGVPFDLDPDGHPALGLEAGHARRRIVHANGGATGQAVVRALTPHVLAQPQLTAWDDARLVGLDSSDGVCGGALVERRGGRRCLVQARATVLATGGACGLYLRTTNPATTAGDGIALAYLAGAAVADLEFVQFHPTAFAQGQPAFLLSEALRGEGAELWNLRGERFMERYDPAGELAPRDVVARSITEEMARTGTDHVELRLEPMGAARDHFARLFDGLRARGVDPFAAPIPVAPAAHYLMGGVVVDLYGRTRLPRLYAVGEAACTGVHGSNRLASNSLLECLVFGHRAAEAAIAEPGLGAPTREPRAVAGLPPELRRQLGAWMFEDAGIVRTAAGLARLSERLAGLPPSTERIVSGLIADNAALRHESRGAHFRLDFPEEDPALARHLVQTRGEPTRAEVWD